MSVTVFRITAYVPHPLPVSPAFIQVSGSCPNATSLVALSVGDSRSANTSGRIVSGSPIAAIFASTTSYNDLRECLNHMGTGAVQLSITYTLTNGIMMVSAISCQPVANALLAIQQQVTAMANTSAQISQRLEKDLSGAVLEELRTLNHQVREALDIFRAEMGIPRAGRSNVESDFGDLIQPHPLTAENQRNWPDSSNGVESESTPVEERHAG